MLSGMWLTGAEGSLPAAGVTARLYFATDTPRIFLDTGSAWVRLNLVHRGTYAGGTTYYDKDLVTYNGSVWRALATVTGVTPVEGADWTLFVSKGDTGTTSGAAGGDLSGTYPNPQIAAGVILDADVNASAAIAESKLALASDAAAGTASRRTLGTSGTSAAAGNDSRLSNARTPTAHAASHNPSGADVIQRFHTIYWVFDGTLAVTTGNKQVPIFIPTGSNTPTLVSVAVRITTAPTGSAVTFDLNKNGTTIWTGGTNRLTVAASANSGSTTTFDVSTFASLDYFTVDIDTVGSTTAGTHAVFALTYRY